MNRPSTRRFGIVLLISLMLFIQLAPNLPILPSTPLVHAATTSNAVWGSIIPLPNDSPFTDRTPSIIRLRSGTIAVVWAHPSTSGGLYDLFLMTKTGSIWASPIPVDEGGLAGADDNAQPSLVQLSDGSLMVFWAACPANQSTSCNVVYNDYSLATGLWTGVSFLTNDQYYNAAPSVMLTSKGALCVFWQSTRGDLSNDDIYYSCSKDNGTSWTPDPVIQIPARMPFSVTGVEDDFPSTLSSNNGGLLLAWTSYRNISNSTARNANLFFTSWNGTYNPSNPSTGWGSQIQLTTDPHDSFEPALASTKDGGVWLVFQSDRDSTSLTAFVDLYFKRSYDPMNLTSWSVDRRLTTDTNDNWQASAFQVQSGVLGVVWSSNQPPASSFDLFYNSLSFQNLQVLSVSPTPSVAPGSTVSIAWNVANRGNSTQSVSLNLYWNATHSINSTPITQPSLAPGLNWTSSYSWNTVGLTPGVYNILVQVSCGCLNEENLSDNSLSSTTIIAIRDVGIQSITIPQFIYQGQTISVNVTVVNEDPVLENFNLLVFYNSTIKTFGTSTVSSLPPGSTRTVSFLWNTTNVKPGSCLLSAFIPPLPTETHASDNNKTAQSPQWSCPRKVGDVDTVADGAVSVDDLIAVWQHEFTQSRQYEVDGCAPQAPQECFPDHFVDIDDLIQTYVHEFT